MVRYLRKSKFSKESSLTGSWSEKIFQIHKVRKAHEFNPIHTCILSELGKETPHEELPPIREHHLKKAFITKTDTFVIERILDAKRNKVLINLEKTSFQLIGMLFTKTSSSGLPEQSTQRKCG